MLCSKGALAVAEQAVEKLVVSDRQTGHDCPAWGKTTVPQVFDGAQELGRLAWSLIPAHMFQRRGAQDEVVAFRGNELHDVLVDDAGRDFVLIDHVMVDREIVREHVADFQNAFGLMAEQNLSEDRDFNAALVFPCLVAEVIEVPIGPPIEDEGLGSRPAGQRHFGETPMASESAFIADSDAGVIVGVGHEETDYSKTMREPGDFILKICKAL